MFLPVTTRRVPAFAVLAAMGLTACQGVFADAQTPAPVTAPPAPVPTMTKPAPPAQPAPKPVVRMAPAPKLPANVYARVGGQDITTQEILQFLSELGGYPLVRQKVQVIVAEREAKRLGVTVTEAELDKAVADQKKAVITNSAMQGHPMTFEDFGAKEGIGAGLLRQQTKFQLLLRKSFAKSYVNGVGSLKGKLKISHILIATRPLPAGPGEAPKPETPADTARLDAEALVKVKQVQADLAAKKFKTFNDAAVQYSDDPNKIQNKGVIGWIDKNIQLPPEFLTAALKLQKVGEVTAPVKTQLGYHLIRLDAKGDDTTPAQRAVYLKQVEDTADSQAIQNWFGAINSKAQITYNPLAKLNLPSAPAVKRSALRP